MLLGMLQRLSLTHFKLVNSVNSEHSFAHKVIFYRNLSTFLQMHEPKMQFFGNRYSSSYFESISDELFNAERNVE